MRQPIAGNGIAGDITLNIEEAVTVSGASETFNVNGQDSNKISLISSGLDLGATGESGTISIASGSLNLNGGGRVLSSTFGTGDAGQIILDVDTLSFDGGGEDIASQTVINSGVYSTVEADGEGNAGGIDITTSELSLTNGGVVNGSIFGRGTGGTISVNANNISIDGVGTSNFSSAIGSTMQGENGDAGNIAITTNNLFLNNGGRILASTLGMGNAGNVEIKADNSVSLFNNSFIRSTVETGAEGDGGDIDLEANSLTLTEGSQIQTGVFQTIEVNGMTISGGKGDAGDINLNIRDTLTASGFIETEMGRFSSGIFSTINGLGAMGEGGNINIVADSVSLTDNATFNVANLANFGEGSAGRLTIQSNSLSLDENASINASTNSGEGGNIDLQISKDITLENNSFISAQAFDDASGGNLIIDARFILAFPSSGTGNDLVAAAQNGTGGNIKLNVEQLFGLRQRGAIDENNNFFLINNTNDIDVSGNVNGNLNININSFDPLRGTTELSTDVMEPGKTTIQACQINREVAAKNNFVIEGKGGIPAEPGLPLDSLNVTVNGEANPVSTVSPPLKTSRGKIQPARGIRVTKSGEVILTAYRTNNAGSRTPRIERNCG